MATDIIMPQLGESVAEGVIGKWLKAEGEQIEKDEPIVEVITDKVNAEIPSPLAGVLEQIVQPEGATVAVGEVIGRIGDGNGAAAQQETEAQPEPQVTDTQPVAQGAEPSWGQPAEATDQPVAAPAEASAQPFAEVSEIEAPGAQPEGQPQPSGGNGQQAAAPPSPQPVAQQSAPAPPSHSEWGERVRSSPLVRRLAAEHGIDLAEVPGTGIGGRVSKQDILHYVEQRGRTGQQVAVPSLERETVPAAQAADAVAPETPSEAPAAQAPAPPQVPPPARAPAAQQPQIPVPPAPPRQAGVNEELIPITPVRKMIANRMVQSKTTIPHATTMLEVDMTNVVRYREAKKGEFLQREGVPLSYVAFVIKAAVEALKEFPMVNSEWAGDTIMRKNDININVAVDAPDGLTTPVIHHADEKSLAGLSKAIYDLAMRARNKQLRLEDMQGGTFTVNNTGPLGSVWSISIINYPQAAILAAASIVKRPVVLEQDGQDVIAVRHMMNLSLSFDHRVLDGGEAASFINAIKDKLEHWKIDYPIY